MQTYEDFEILQASDGGLDVRCYSFSPCRDSSLGRAHLKATILQCKKLNIINRDVGGSVGIDHRFWSFLRDNDLKTTLRGLKIRELDVYIDYIRDKVNNHSGDALSVTVDIIQASMDLQSLSICVRDFNARNDDEKRQFQRTLVELSNVLTAHGSIRKIRFLFCHDDFTDQLCDRQFLRKMNSLETIIVETGIADETRIRGRENDPSDFFRAAPSLKECTLFGQLIRPSSFRQYFSTCTLEKLRLIHVLLEATDSDRAVQADYEDFFRALGSHPSVSTLTLEEASSEIPTPDASAFGMALADNHVLKTLNVATKNDNNYVEAVAVGLANNTSLVEVTLNVYKTVVGPSFVNALSTGLKQNSTLRRLDLRIPIPLTLLKDLGHGIVNNRGLTKLELYFKVSKAGDNPDTEAAILQEFCQSIGDEKSRLENLVMRITPTGGSFWSTGCIEDCIEKLLKNPMLRDIQIYFGVPKHAAPYTQKTGDFRRLLGTIRQHMYLENFFIGRHQLGENKNEFKQAVEMTTRLNKAGRRYIHHDNRLERGVGVLSQVSDNLNCLYTHLVENASLFFK